MIDQDYKNGWRYIVWVGGNDDYYKKIADAKKDFEYWVDDGYDDVFLTKLLPSGKMVDLNKKRKNK
jgi:hypothetical protein|tara:strand:- start:1952 stop:2149 length:198 start_codon:yes stop_codon:yes gene_type:complete